MDESIYGDYKIKSTKNKVVSVGVQVDMAVNDTNNCISKAEFNGNWNY